MAAVGEKGFFDNPGKIHLTYAAGFIIFVVILAIAEDMGMSNASIGYAYLGITIGLYTVIGLFSRSTRVPRYCNAESAVPAIFNGMAAGADWMDAAAFIGMAGAIFVLGHDGLAYVMGWTGGYVLLAVFFGPYLRKFGRFTIPDFLGARYGGSAARMIGIIATITVLFTCLIAQVTGVGIIVSRFLSLDFKIGVFVGLAAILACSMLGGTKMLTWTQAVQFVILGIAYLLPPVIMSQKVTGVPIPQVTYGQVLQKIDAAEKAINLDPKETAVRDLWSTESARVGADLSALAKSEPIKPYLQPFARLDKKNMLALIFCLMVGTAGFPHLLMRYYATPSAADARRTATWTLFFIALLYFTAPAVAAFGRNEVLSNVIGLPIANLPAWIADWGKVGLVSFRDINADGILQFSELTIGADAIVLALPEIAGLPYVISGLVAAGALVAVLSVANGLLLTISNTLSHDLYPAIVDNPASIMKRLAISRALLVVTALIAAGIATFKLTISVELVAWAFSIAAASFFPALVMGIWDKRANRAGAVAGMGIGFGSCLFYIIGGSFYGLDWWGIKTIASGIFGIPLGFAAIYVVSRMTAAPPQELQDFVENVRITKGTATAQMHWPVDNPPQSGR